MDGLTATEIAKKVNKELHPNPALTREGIYPALRRARDHGFIKLDPPIEETLGKSIEAKYNCPNQVRVVDTAHQRASASVADAAADLTMKLMKELALNQGSAVGLGLGPGRATLDFSKRLSNLLRTDKEPPDIGLYAISAGCPARSPEYAPTSCFSFFPTRGVVERVGMFAELVVPAGQLKSIKGRPGVKEVFEAREKEKIQIIVSSMGDFDDVDDLLRQFLLDAGLTLPQLKRSKWIGNVQYRPFTAEGPVVEKNGYRAVTLYELDDLKEFASKKGRHVILMARQCALCGKTRAKSLRPLLTVPKLRVFSELVLDSATARELLAGDE
jgi:DNA-binding transcriptional regulator LsrR (DeoR family)